MDEYSGHFQMIDPRVIVIDHRYQRPNKPALIGAISTDPRWELFGVPTLFKRGNIFYCGDGQQRILGVLNSAKPPKLIPAVWFEMSHLRDEAAVFVQINEFRIALSAMEKHRGRIVAEDPIATIIERVAKKVGVTISDRVGDSNDIHTITAVSSLYWIYNLIAEEGLTQTLTVCRDAWPDDNGKFSAPIMRVVAVVIAEQGETYERARLTGALSKHAPGKIIRKSQEIQFDIGGSRGVNMRRAVKVLAKV